MLITALTMVASSGLRVIWFTNDWSIFRVLIGIRGALSIPLRRCGLHAPLLITLLILLPHYGVTRLVTVTLLLELTLLLYLSGIAISRMLPLVGGNGAGAGAARRSHLSQPLRRCSQSRPQ